MGLASPEDNLMAGSYLLQQFLQAQWVTALANRLLINQQLTEVHVENLANLSIKALLMASVFQQINRPLVVVCADPQIALKYQIELQQYLPPERVERYPAEEFSPYDLSVFPVKSLAEQYRILHRLQDKSQKPFILLISAKNLLLKHLSQAEMDEYALRLAVEDEMAPEQLATRCLELGYIRVSLVMEPGEFSSRGDIFDLYPVQGQPVRIEFFGDTVESMRIIDVENQRSVTAVESVVAIPRAGIVLNPENKQLLAEKLLTALAKQKSRLAALEYEGLETTIQNQLQAMEQAFLTDGVDYYAPLVHQDFKTVLDYLPDNAVAVLDDWDLLVNNLGGLSDRLSRQYQEGVEKGRLLDLGFQYHLSDSDALAQFQQLVPRRLFLDSFAVSENPTETPNHFFPVELVAPQQFKADMKIAAEAFQTLRRQGAQLFITTDHPQRVLDNLKEWDIPGMYWGDEGIPLETVQSPAFAKGLDVIVSKSGPHEGFVLPKEKLAHFTDTELFGRKLKKLITTQKGVNKRDDIDVINSIHDLRQGDFVVHAKHGIGKFIELSQISIDGEKREYLSIQYSGSDRLHVPVDQVNLLSRYRGAGDTPPKLSKMGGIEWSSVKKKVKKSIESIAKDLVALYASRAKAKGHMFEPDTPWQVEMEEAFPYTETPDQWQAIMDTKRDMESDKPMDRLICGDVGFGKTEVALRALFKCILSGKQAALLCPTTILAQQHFNTLSDRLKPYPMKVGLLSRFRSPKEQKEVVNRLVLGECDVVVGTHRLLQKDVKFKDLGLLVIDEEQRFGVTHKEKLKQLRTEVDVLTLSATPIPRTLYMSLSGVREMSLINTPPVNRAPIKTFVGPYNPAQIRMAILQELDRGGQVYFVHNRVQTIYSKAEELQNLVPEVRIVVGHGQMNTDALETVMLDFAQQQYDVLLCTTIIESGLDIPNVNTIIVDRADRFGLAQLYQIRGRVGRGPIQAYAYCYYDPDRPLTEDGKDRLRAIREFTTLGSGYQIALRDLEIRGVGNILGSEQHGHMVAVGFDMYCQMLEESIQEVQGNVVEEKEDSIIDLNVTALIPDAWVGDRNVKLSEYKRLAALNSEMGLEVIQAEWQDRFGDIPAETQQLMNLVRLRIQATDLGIPLVRADEEFLRISAPYTLQEWMKLQTLLPNDLAKKLRWVPGISSKQGSTPVLLLKLLGMTGDDQVTFLMALFKALAKTITKLTQPMA